MMKINEVISEKPFRNSGDSGVTRRLAVFELTLVVNTSYVIIIIIITPTH